MLYIKNINYPIKKSKIIIYKTPAGLLISSFNLFFLSIFFIFISSPLNTQNIIFHFFIYFTNKILIVVCYPTYVGKCLL